MEIELLLFHFWPFAHIGTINFIISLNWHKHGASRFWKILSQLPEGSRWTCQQRAVPTWYPSRGWMSFTYTYTQLHSLILRRRPTKPTNIPHFSRPNNQRQGRTIFYKICLQGLAESRPLFTQRSFVSLSILVVLNVEIPDETKELNVITDDDC